MDISQQCRYFARYPAARVAAGSESRPDPHVTTAAARSAQRPYEGGRHQTYEPVWPPVGRRRRGSREVCAPGVVHGAVVRCSGSVFMRRRSVRVCGQGVFVESGTVTGQIVVLDMSTRYPLAARRPELEHQTGTRLRPVFAVQNVWQSRSAAAQVSRYARNEHCAKRGGGPCLKAPVFVQVCLNHFGGWGVRVWC